MNDDEAPKSTPPEPKREPPSSPPQREPAPERTRPPERVIKDLGEGARDRHGEPEFDEEADE